MAAIKIWDSFIRSYHWLIVAAFVLNYFLLEPGEQAHQIVGYTAVTLVLLRIMWGFCGPPNARITSFLPTKSRLKKHIDRLRKRQIPVNEGHNPIGGVLILVFWLLLLSQGISGYLLEETDRFFGSLLLEDIHEWTAHLLYIGVIIHIVAVIVVGWWGKVQLLKPMITGKRDDL